MELSDMHYSKKRKYRYPAKSRRIWIMISVLLVSCCILDLIYYKKVQDGLLEQTYSDLKKESNIARGNLESRLQAKQEWLERFVIYRTVQEPKTGGIRPGSSAQKITDWKWEIRRAIYITETTSQAMLGINRITGKL